MRRRTFANSLEGVQNDVRLFKVYMTREKPPKCQEKVNIEANFFEIEMKLKELRQNPFVPPEGQRLPDIDQVTMQWTLSKTSFNLTFLFVKPSVLSEI